MKPSQTCRHVGRVVYLCDPSEGGRTFPQSSFSFIEEKKKKKYSYGRQNLFRISIYLSLCVQENAYLLLQCRVQTTIRMRAVRIMTKTGTRTAASATSEGRKATISIGRLEFPLATKSHSDLPWPVCGGIVVFRMSGVCVVWLACGGDLVLTGLLP